MLSVAVVVGLLAVGQMHVYINHGYRRKRNKILKLTFFVLFGVRR